MIVQEHRDILMQPPLRRRPRLTTRLIGIHTSAAGGVENAAERAFRLGCNTLQFFSSSPRQWKPYVLAPSQCEKMTELCGKYNLRPLVIHANYLINLAGMNAGFYRQSIDAFRQELVRAMALRAEYLVLHPGSFRGDTRENGLQRVIAGIEEAAGSLDLAGARLTILIENTAGAEFSLGGQCEQVAEIIERLRPVAPAAACIDTCHLHVAGYDIVSKAGYDHTLRHLEETIGLQSVRVWHCNDSKAAGGSHLDRHQHIGQGSMGLPPFRRLLNDPRLAHAAFIAETPIDLPGDDVQNIKTLKALVRSRS